MDIIVSSLGSFLRIGGMFVNGVIDVVGTFLAELAGSAAK